MPWPVDQYSVMPTLSSDRLTREERLRVKCLNSLLYLLLHLLIDDDRCALLFFSASWLVKIVDFIVYTSLRLMFWTEITVSP